MENAKQVIAEVTKAVSQKSASKKDEITVMKAMMNDPEFSVGVYDKTGKIEDYTPGKDFRKVVSNAISATTKISGKEAAELLNNYEFTKSDASAMVGFAKEFVHTYLHTGRKLPLGGRENSNVELMWKEIADRTAGIPGSGSGDARSQTFIPAHGGVKASCPCPSWVVGKKK